MIFKKFNSPSDNFEVLIKILRFTGSVCGVDLLRPNYRMNWITYTLFVGIFAYFLFVFLTIFNYYKDDPIIIVWATVTLSSSFQGVSKLYNYISRQNVIMDLYLLLSKIYKDYEKRGTKYRDALYESAENNKKGLIYLMVIYISSPLGMMTLPMISYIVTGKRSLVLEFEIPGLDINTDYGYYMTFILQSILVTASAFGLYGGDLMAMMYLKQAFMFSNVFRAKIEYLNEMIVDPEDNKKSSVTEALKDLVKWHQLYSDYINRVNSLCYYMITVQIVTSFCSTITCLYLIISGGVPGAYTYVLISFGTLYLYCILGTETEIANDKFTDDVFDIHWYNLTTTQQKIVFQILCKSQSPQTIDIAGVMPLSVSSAMKLTKTVYSMTMYMIEFME